MIVLELRRFIQSVKAILKCLRNGLDISRQEDLEVKRIIMHLSRPLLQSIQIKDYLPINLKELFLPFSDLKSSLLKSLNSPEKKESEKKTLSLSKN
jgi:hypothetical protein